VTDYHIRLGVTKCVSNKECPVAAAECLNGTCRCRDGDDFTSEDKITCQRKKNIKT